VIEALAGKKVVGAPAGAHHKAVWTEAGNLLTLGMETVEGWLGHGVEKNELVPRLVEALAGEKVIVAAAGHLLFGPLLIGIWGAD